MYTKGERTSELSQGLSLINHEFKHVLEFGVFKGKTLSIIRRKLDESFQVFGFDSFEGLPEDWIGKDGVIVGEDSPYGACCKNRFDRGGRIPKISGVTFFKGWFTDTLKDYLSLPGTIGLLHVDCDLYSSAKEVLFALNPRILPGSILVFDEWFYDYDENNDDHEKRAFLEWSQEFNRGYEEINPSNFKGEYRGKVNCQKLIRVLE